MWCEQQLHYSFEKPTLVRENEAANKGSELHLERELETQDYVDVEVETKEDIFAVKLFNLVKSLEELGYTYNVQSLDNSGEKIEVNGLN